MTSRASLVFRIVLILALGYAAFFLILETEFWLAGIWVSMFSIIAIVNLVLYLERAKRELYNFLSAIKQGDFTQTKSMTRSVWENDKLNEVYREIQQVFLKLNSEKAQNHLFLQTILEHVEIAIIAFDKKQNIVVSNQAVRSMFGTPHFKTLKKLFRNEPELVSKITGEHLEGSVFKIKYKEKISILSINSSEFKLDGVPYKLVSFQDIRPELEEKELDSWQKLIRVLTHEIMNSAIPISTLAGVIAKMIINESGDIKESLDQDTKNDIYGGLQTIENRSKGLSAFVDSYRSLTKIKPPKFEEVSTKILIEEVLNLLREKIVNRNITVHNDITELNILIDKALISQVLINLILNAIESFESNSNRDIFIAVLGLGNTTTIKIRDNGKGIEENLIDDIFIPFYTTKKEGTGVGLSLARQIMRLHKGKISVQSELKKGTTFTLEF